MIPAQSQGVEGNSERENTISVVYSTSPPKEKKIPQLHIICQLITMNILVIMYKSCQSAADLCRDASYMTN